MSAAALLMILHSAGASVVRAEGDELVVAAPGGTLSPLLVSQLRDRKPVLLEVLTGRRCRYCEGPLDWRRPGWVPFADERAAHLGCYEQAEVARLLTAGERAVRGGVTTYDGGELVVEDEP